MITVQSDPVPSSFCPIKDSDWQLLVSLLHAQSTGDPTVNTGSITPPPDKRGLPWIRSNPDGTPDRTYVFSNGLWRSPHPEDPGIVKMWTGTLAGIDLIEGGVAGAVTSDSGPFWAKMTGVDAMMPIQPGTLPSTAVINISDTGGEEKHTLIATESPPHTHRMFTDENIANGTGLQLTNARSLAGFTNVPKQVNDDGAGDANSYYMSSSSVAPTLGQTDSFGGTGGATNAHNNLPPYFGIWFIQRTNRIYYSQPA